MSAVDWTAHHEPWRTVGPDWAKQVERIARNPIALTPPEKPDAAKWKIEARPARAKVDSEGARLRYKRVAAGLSQESLAKRLGVNRRYVSMAERGVLTRWMVKTRWIERCLAAIDDRTSAREAAATER